MIAFALNRIYKAEYEEMYRAVQFRRPDGNGWLGEGDTLSACAVVVEPWPDGDAVSGIVSGATVQDGTMVRYFLVGGTKGMSYLLRIRATDTSGQKFEARQRITVI